MHDFIPLSVPNLKGNELEYVTNAIKTEWVSTGGPYVDEFENKIAAYVKAEGAVSCQNGTSGIHTAMITAGITKEDIVLVPTLTFIAAVNPVMYIGAEPVFMDCDDSLCLDPEKLQDYCEHECELRNDTLFDIEKNKPVKAVVVVHVFGNMADMERITRIAGEYHLKVIEDATEAIGTYYTAGKYAGKYAGTIGDIGVYSFNGNKIITTGGGGMIVSNCDTYLTHARHLTTQAKSDALYYEHDEIGYNYRMTNLQAALGLAQLEQLEEFITTKINNYSLYQKRVSKIEGLSFVSTRACTRGNHWFYGLSCEGFRKNRDQVIQLLSKENIQSRPIWGLIHEQIPYKGMKAYRIENALKKRETIVNIPCSTNLTKEQVERVMDVIEGMT